MGPGVLLPGIGSALAGLFGLGRMGRADEIVRQLGQPGYLPGTTGAGDDLVKPRATEEGGGWGYDWIAALPVDSRRRIVDLLNRWGQTDPRALGYTQQMEENFANRAYQQKRAGAIVDLMRGGQERAAGFRERGEQVGGKIEAIGDKATGYAEAILKDPNAISQGEMNALVGQMIGEANDVYKARGRQLETTAAGRGLTPAAVAALQQQLDAENYRANQQSVGQVAAVNAAERAKIRQAALDYLGSVPDIYARGAGVQGLYEGLGEGAENRLAAALATEAATHQPLDYMIGPEMSYEGGLAQAMREAGLTEDEANLLMSLSGGLGQYAQSALERKALREASGGGDYAGIGSGLGTLGGSGLGWLLAGPTAFTPAGFALMGMGGLLGSGVGGGLGGLFSR